MCVIILFFLFHRQFLLLVGWRKWLKYQALIDLGTKNNKNKNMKNR